MSDLFQMICPFCGSKLNAKASLIGQTRNCPKCKGSVLIQREGERIPMTVNEPSIVPVQTGPTFGDRTNQIENLPEQLVFRNKYLIIGSDRIIAVWETGKGWQVNVGSGFASAKRNFSAIPDQGSFVLVELVVGLNGIPSGLNVFSISMRGALTSLFRDESEILHKIDRAGQLTKIQKNLLLNHLRQIFMFDVLAEAREVIDFLSEQ
jgi:Zn-finger nucleic acid-binding protein